MKRYFWLIAAAAVPAWIGIRSLPTHQTGSEAPVSPNGIPITDANVDSLIAQMNSSTAVATPIAPVAPPSHWSTHYEQDPMRNTSVKYTQNIALNKLDFNFPYQGGQKGVLIVRGRKTNPDIGVLVSKGQFMCGVDCSISAKFDNGSIQNFSAVKAADGSFNYIFVENAPRFLKQLRAAKSLIVEADFYREGTHQLNFNVEGLDW